MQPGLQRVHVAKLATMRPARVIHTGCTMVHVCTRRRTRAYTHGYVCTHAHGNVYRSDRRWSRDSRAESAGDLVTSIVVTLQMDLRLRGLGSPMHRTADAKDAFRFPREEIRNVPVSWCMLRVGASSCTVCVMMVFDDVDRESVSGMVN